MISIIFPLTPPAALISSTAISTATVAGKPGPLRKPVLAAMWPIFSVSAAIAPVRLISDRNTPRTSGFNSFIVNTLPRFLWVFCPTSSVEINSPRESFNHRGMPRREIYLLQADPPRLQSAQCQVQAHIHILLLSTPF